MKLEYLKLTNFRGFREFEITFDPQFTVLLGANMAGKTAVLDAAALALKPLLNVEPDIEHNDIRRIVADINGSPDLQLQFSVMIEARASSVALRDSLVLLNISRPHENARTSVRGSNIDHRLLAGVPLGQNLPIIAQYGTQRHWLRINNADDIRGVGSRHDGYTGCFDVRSTHSVLAGWIRKQTLVQLQRGNGYVQPQLTAVESAIKSCIDDVKRFWYDVEHDELRLERPNGDIQSFATLSEGLRNMVAMIADIAWRAAVLNPHHGPEANQHTDGVVLIDELDLHLHPKWQRRIVADLRRTFPKIQFIVTTHSPQIVASVNRDQVRLLDHNQLVSDKPYVEGRDASEILEDVFGVAARPEAVKAEIDELFRLIEDEDFGAARRQLAALEERLGPHDAEMVRARWILDTEELQANRQPAAAP